MRNRLAGCIVAATAAALIGALPIVNACADDGPPFVIIMGAEKGRKLAGTVGMQVLLNKTSGLESVELLVDGRLIGTVLPDPFIVPWDTTRVDDGEHTIRVVATYEDGSTSESEPVSVTVKNVYKVWMIGLKEGQKVSGTVQIGARVEKKSGLMGVEFLVDQRSMRVVTQEPFTVEWDTTKADNGEHKLKAKAIYADATTEQAKTLVVTVNNREANTIE